MPRFTRASAEDAFSREERETERRRRFDGGARRVEKCGRTEREIEPRRGEGGRRGRGGEPPDRVVSFIKKFFITLCERMCYSTEEDLPRPA